MIAPTQPEPHDEALELRLEGLTSALSLTSDAVYLVDREGRFVYANERFLNFLNVTSADLIGRTVVDLGYPPELARKLLQEVRQTFDEKRETRGSTPLTRADGSIGYYDYTFTPVLDQSGTPRLVAGCSHEVTKRRRSEEAMRAMTDEQHLLIERLALEREWLNSAQSIAKIGSWVHDLKTDRLEWSPECYRIFGIPLDEPNLRAASLERIHPDDRSRLEDTFLRASDRSAPWQIKHRLLFPDGTIKWIEERVESFQNDAGEPLKAVGTVQDITHQKAAETEAHNREQLLRMATRLARIGAWDVDLLGSTVFWSDEVCAIHGVEAGYRPTVAEAIDFYAPEDRPVIIERFEACVANGTPFDVELQIITINGDRVWVRAIGAAEIDHSGRVVAVRGAFQDLSEQKKAGDALRLSDERFRMIARATTDVIWDWDVVKGTWWWSDGIRMRFGHGDPIPEQAFWLDKIDPRDRMRVTQSLRAALESGSLWSEDYRFLKGDGTYAEVRDRGLLVRDAAGRVVRVVSAMLDVTQQRALEAQLEQMQRVSGLGQLAASMAHEFNNVLMGIQPFVEIIRRTTGDLPKVQDATSHIARSVKRGKKVTEEILSFTRRVEPSLSPMDVKDWLLSFSEEGAALAPSLRIEIIPPPEDLQIQGDISQLNQVLANLVINARDASPPEARLIISAERASHDSDRDDRQNFVDISVRDFGSGMDETTLKRVFEPLFTTKKTGTGLGMAISNQVIVKHGGTIHAESQVGSGTAFHIVLPLIGVRTEPLAAERSAGNTRSVLIVEDESQVATGISMILDAEGTRNHVVTAAAAVIPAIEQHTPDCVLIDVGLPDVSGVVVAEQILARWPDLPVVLMSGHFNPTELMASLSVPNIRFLQKPFTTEELLRALNPLTPAEK